MYIKEHNKEAYKNLKSTLEKENRACVVMPTGSGKSYVALQLMAEFRKERILFVTSQKVSLGRFTSLAEKEINYKESEYDTALYAGLKNLQLKKNQYDYIILDEFHRAGATVWGEGVTKLLEKNQNAKVVGFSATPIRYLDDMRDMAEELFERAIAFEMSLAEAIARRILPTPEYITCIYNMKEQIDILEKKFGKSVKKNDSYIAALIRKAKSLVAEAPELSEILKNHINPNGRYIVFCSDIENLKAYVSLSKFWFKDVTNTLHRYSVYTGAQQIEKRVEEFTKTDKDGLKLLFCVDMLNEGIHAENIDGVILLRKTESANVHLQQIGRALSAGGKTNPQIIDLVDNFQTLRFGDRLAEDINAFLKQEGEDIIFRITTELKDLVETLKEIEAELSFSWDDWFAYAKAYYEEHGDLLIPKRYETNNIKIGRWIEVQRIAYKENRLSEARIQELDDIGMVWDIKAMQWNEIFLLAKAYYEKHGNLLIPSSYKVGDIHLGGWVLTQREARKKGKMSEKRIQALESIGMVWDTKEASWENYYASAKAYYKEHGNLYISNKYKANGLNLGQWIQNQRGNYKRGTLSEDRIQALEAIGMVWNVKAAVWENYYASAKAYYETYGNLLIPRSYKTDVGSLGAWVQNQRGDYKRGTLSEDRIQALESIGMVWDTKEASWEKCYALAKAYYEAHGNLRVPHSYKVDAVSLGEWIATQRAAYRKGKMSEKRIQALEAIDMTWDTLEDVWNEKYLIAKKYYEEHGNLIVPWKHEIDGFQLGTWLNNQTNNYKKGLLDQEKVKKLESIGMVWTRLEDVWNEKYLEAKKYYEEHGDLLVPRGYVAGNFSLDVWVYRQRTAFKEGKISNERIQALEAIGMVWEPVDEHNWNKVFYYAKAYYEEHGNLLVNHKYEVDGVHLGSWIVRQRLLHNKGTLPIKQAQALESIGMVWNQSEYRWQEGFLIAKAYYQEHKHLKVPRGAVFNGFKLGSWISNQKQAYKNNKLSKEQIRALESIGITWIQPETAAMWEEKYLRAKEFYEEFGHLLVPKDYQNKKGLRVSGWLETQRKAYKKGTLSDARIKALEAIGMIWEIE